MHNIIPVAYGRIHIMPRKDWLPAPSHILISLSWWVINNIVLSQAELLTIVSHAGRIAPLYRCRRLPTCGPSALRRRCDGLSTFNGMDNSI